MAMNKTPELETTLGLNWPSEQKALYNFFQVLTRTTRARPGTTTAILERPGVSYSFRGAIQPPGRARPVYLLLDVIVSSTEPWFLSVCFYQDEITDPEGRGNPVPGGLFGETGYCFDVETPDGDTLDYLLTRLDEAHAAASGLT
ncbi:MAG: hypothetical protein AB1641_00700 [Thermodesulfobacteriota bacterium]